MQTERTELTHFCLLLRVDAIVRVSLTKKQAENHTSCFSLQNSRINMDVYPYTLSFFLFIYSCIYISQWKRS